MIAEWLAFAVLAQAHRPSWDVPHPIPADKVDQAWLARRLGMNGPLLPLDVARELWPASDATLVSMVERFPNYVVGEAGMRGRPSILPVYVKVLATFDGRRAAGTIRGLESLRKRFPASGADRHLIAALDHRHKEVRWAAAETVGPRNRAKSAPILRQILSESPEANRVLAASKTLQACAGKGALPSIAHAQGRFRSNMAADPLNKLAANRLRIDRAELGDRPTLPDIRRYAVQKGDPHLGKMAIDVLGSKYGVSEKSTLHEALRSGAVQRYRAAQWLYYFGDRSGVGPIREAAKTAPFDVKNAGWFRDVNDLLLGMADRIEKGERGPNPKETKVPTSMTGRVPGMRR